MFWIKFNKGALFGMGVLQTPFSKNTSEELLSAFLYLQMDPVFSYFLFFQQYVLFLWKYYRICNNTLSKFVILSWNISINIS